MNECVYDLIIETGRVTMKDKKVTEHIYCVSVYESNRAYGGPEEGGSWYTYGEPVDPHLAFKLLGEEGLPYWTTNGDEARDRCIRLGEKLDLMQKAEGKPWITSVNCPGWYTAVIDEDEAPHAYPRTKPTYE